MTACLSLQQLGEQLGVSVPQKAMRRGGGGGGGAAAVRLTARTAKFVGDPIEPAEASGDGAVAGGARRVWYECAAVDGHSIRLGDTVALQPLASDPSPAEPDVVLVEAMWAEGGAKVCRVRTIWRPKQTFVGDKLAPPRLPRECVPQGRDADGDADLAASEGGAPAGRAVRVALLGQVGVAHAATAPPARRAQAPVQSSERARGRARPAQRCDC